MAIDDSVIDNNLSKLTTEIIIVNSTLKTLTDLQKSFTKIQLFNKNVANDKGGYDVVPTIPNPNQYSEEDNDKVRQIIYDDSIEKISKLNL